MLIISLYPASFVIDCLSLSFLVITNRKRKESYFFFSFQRMGGSIIDTLNSKQWKGVCHLSTCHSGNLGINVLFRLLSLPSLDFSLSC